MNNAMKTRKALARLIIVFTIASLVRVGQFQATSDVDIDRFQIVVTQGHVASCRTKRALPSWLSGNNRKKKQRKIKKRVTCPWPGAVDDSN
ncbi:hypothetical protein DFJ77DRAFT_235138 [Powellomyces hirtus]|nr:hypothetical protein DFJ77DRAFT_235138 [Powellomyces hirtus]